jgi:hypothetical protein
MARTPIQPRSAARNMNAHSLSVGIGAASAMVVASLAELFEGLVSPPPLTVAVFVTLEAALLATVTVSVIGG